jgi:hypothetical protein
MLSKQTKERIHKNKQRRRMFRNKSARDLFLSLYSDPHIARPNRNGLNFMAHLREHIKGGMMSGDLFVMPALVRPSQCKSDLVGSEGRRALMTGGKSLIATKDPYSVVLDNDTLLKGGDLRQIFTRMHAQQQVRMLDEAHMAPRMIVHPDGRKEIIGWSYVDGPYDRNNKENKDAQQSSESTNRP